MPASNSKMTIVAYRCGCGCRVPVDEIVLFRGYGGNRNKNSQARCPYHILQEDSRIVKKICKCFMCGCEFEAEAKGRVCLCDKCKVANYKNSIARNNAIAKNRKKKIKAKPCKNAEETLRQKVNKEKVRYEAKRQRYVLRMIAEKEALEKAKICVHLNTIYGQCYWPEFTCKAKSFAA